MAVPALVLGGPWHTTISVVHALGRAGIPQYTIGGASSFVAYSRWHRALTLPPDIEEPTPTTLRSFLEMVPLEPMMLIPCSDEWVDAVVALPPELAHRFPSGSASPATIRDLLDKGCFAEVVDRLDVPRPRTISVDSPEDAWELAQTLPDPFLKPRRSNPFRERYGIKGVRVTTREDLEQRIRDAHQAGLRLILQDYVPGPATSHVYVDGFVDRGGCIRARFARRRLRTYPEPFGESCCMKSITLSEVEGPIASLDRVLHAVRYRGIFSAEFKWDSRDGLFKIIEINTRVWGGLSLPVRCGVNVVEMAYRDALEQPVESRPDYPAERYWIHGARDVLACGPLLRDRRIRLRDVVSTWLRACQPIATLGDPLPGMYHVAEMLGRRLRP